MNALLNRALARTAGLVAVVLVGAAAVLLVESAAREAAAADRADVMAVSAVVAVTSDRDQVRAAVARTAAGAQGRLAVHLVAGGTVGVGQASAARVSAAVGGGPVPASWHVLPGRAVVELSEPASAVDPGLLRSLALLVGVGAVAWPGAVLVGRRRMAPALNGLRTLVSAARTGAVRVHSAGPPELVELASVVNGNAERTERLLAGEREMVADVSHRLRTPLTVLRLDVDALGSGAVADRIRGAVAALNHEVDRIVESTRPAVVASSRCDLAEVVRSRMDFWSAHASTQGRACDVDVPARPLHVDLGGDELAAAVDAVLDNVFRHTAAGTPVAVQVVEHAGWVTFVVEDGGPGVAAPEHAVHRGVSGGGSTGLGLAIARAAAEQARGSLHVEQGRLGGARIRLRFCSAEHEHPESRPRAWRLWRGAS
ncbi:sensor histidine kinase [Actinosynnema sp. CA-299493]